MNLAYKRITLLYNPNAGRLRGRNLARLDRPFAALEALGAHVIRCATTGPRTAGAIARLRIAEGSDLIVVAGGDGTVNETVEGMRGSDVPLAVLPAGTANVLANEIGVGRSMTAAAHRLPEYVARRVPLGCVDFENGSSRRFLLMAGAGLDGKIVFDVNPGLKARAGKAAYWISGFRQIGRALDQLQVIVGGDVRSCSFALISKVRNYGGDLEIGGDVSLLDERFEVVLFHGRNSYRYLLYLAAIAAKRHQRLRGVEVFRASDLQLLPLHGAAVHLQVDGEYAGLLPASVRTPAGYIMLLMPPGYPK